MVNVKIIVKVLLKIGNGVMNRRIKKFICSICLVTMSLSVTYSYGGTYYRAFALEAGTPNGIGVIDQEEQWEIANGVVLNSFKATSPTTKEQRGQTITFNPKSSDVNVVMDFGSSLFSRKNLSSMVKSYEDQGYTVIGGINGDFFHMDSGVPVGFTVQNGRLVSANGIGWSAEGVSSGFWNAVGFKKDGSVIIGNPDLQLGYTVNGSTKTQNILRFNKKRDDQGVFLYTSDYSANTQTDMNSLDVVLKIKSGEVKLGQPIKCTVEKITEEVKYTPIEQGKLLLSAEVYTPGFFQLKELKLGDEVNILMTDKSGQWNDVVQAIGGYKVLLKNGLIQPELDTTSRYPTTAVGVKNNGEVVFLQVDGRQPGWSNGIPYIDTAQYLKSIGCVNAFLLDGGGSSTIMSKLPYEEKALVKNRPSDGSERAVGNGLLLLAKAKRSGQFAKLYAYPSKVRMLKGSSVNLDVKAADSSYYPVALPANITYTASQSLGRVSANGVFTAGDTKGNGKVTITSGTVSTSVDIEVVDSITNIKVSTDNISVAPGKTQKINAEAYYNNMLLVGTNNQFKWSLSDPKLGTIDSNGTFTSGNNVNITGTINVSYGNYTKKINVEVGKLPVVIEDFEKTALYPAAGAAWTVSGVRHTSVNGEIIANDSEHVKSGNKALKLSYDFTGREDGTAGAYVQRLNTLSPTALPSKQEDMIKIEGYPTAIGMWVYGDNSRNWLRGQLRDANNNIIALDFTSDYDGTKGGIDWTGWKYVEAKIPENIQTPLYLDIPVRVMCTRNEYRNKGTIYIDGIRTVYGYEPVTTPVPEIPVQDKASLLVYNALRDKTFYSFNIALYETTKLTDEVSKARLLSKLASIENIVWTEDVKQVYSRLKDLAATGSARIYDETQVYITNSGMSPVDKDYLLWELTTWGKDLVWTEDYKTAMKYFVDFCNELHIESAIIAETHILEVKNSYSREYLLEELDKIKEANNIR